MRLRCFIFGPYLQFYVRCHGDRACHEAGDDGDTVIGNYACNGKSACNDAGEGGFARIGDEACHGFFACDDAGSDNGTDGSGSGSGTAGHAGKVPVVQMRSDRVLFEILI